MLNSNDILKEKKWKWIKNTNYNNVFLSFGGENNAIALVCSNFLKMYNDVSSQTKKKKPPKNQETPKYQLGPTSDSKFQEHFYNVSEKLKRGLVSVLSL